ncbi:MAG: WD40 repeat domain-containing protein [Desulfocapsa sp.]|nr:WD40 repeat domain-containing protein [Desulfocapsa sp.]
MNYFRIILISVCFLLVTFLSSASSSTYLIGVGENKGLWTKATLTSSWVMQPQDGEVLDVAVMPDGRILGVGNSYGLWVKNSLTSPWTAVPGSGNVISACVMNNGTILGVGINKGLLTKATLTSPWVMQPQDGEVLDVAVMPDGRILGVGNSHGLWVKNSLASPWVAVPGEGEVISVTVMDNGTIIGVGMSKGLWTKATLTSPWRAVPNSGNVIAVTNGSKLGDTPSPPKLILFAPCVSVPGKTICESAERLNVNPDEIFEVSWYVENLGGSSSSAEMRYYYSSDYTISTVDQLVRTNYVSVGGYPWGGRIETTLPAPKEPGEHHVGTCAENSSGFRCRYAGTINVVAPGGIVTILNLLLDNV